MNSDLSKSNTTTIIETIVSDRFAPIMYLMGIIALLKDFINALFYVFKYVTNFILSRVKMIIVLLRFNKVTTFRLHKDKYHQD